jgi:uncharacterized membrane protein YuzA (DUF378 family)
VKAVNLIALIFVIVGGINWLLVGLFQFDLVVVLFGGQDSGLARIVDILVGFPHCGSSRLSLAPFPLAKRLPSADVDE